jgi:adenylate kinase
MKHFKKPTAMLIMGPQGSGKGTQAKLLAKKFGFEYVGSGDSLRVVQKTGSFTGKKLFKVMNTGALVPNFALVNVLGNVLEKLKKRGKVKGVILDGWNRMMIESIMVDEALEWYEWDKNVKIILINISRKESYNRLTKRRQCNKCGQLIPWMGEFKNLKKCDKCGGELVVRPDDNLASIKKRLEEYKNQTVPVVNLYKKRGELIVINGEQSIEDVFKEVLKKL